MKRCDLHTHSLFSDGSNTPAEIIAQAKELGLTVALTDHNTVNGLPDFVREAEEQGVTVVPGIEISTDYEGTELHLLGLFIAPERYKQVEFFMNETRLLKEISNIEMIERLNDAGYEVDYVSIKKRNSGDNVNRAHVAAELMEKGYVSSIKEAFQTILHEDRGFYVPPARLQLLDAIVFLREIKSLPILAHPLQELDEAALRALLPKAMEAGMLGIEILHSSYSEEKKALAARIAEEFGLAVSGGSDYHGVNKPDISLGVGKGDLVISEQIYLDLLELSRSL